MSSLCAFSNASDMASIVELALPSYASLKSLLISNVLFIFSDFKFPVSGKSIAVTRLSTPASEDSILFMKSSGS